MRTCADVCDCRKLVTLWQALRRRPFSAPTLADKGPQPPTVAGLDLRGLQAARNSGVREISPRTGHGDAEAELSQTLMLMHCYRELASLSMSQRGVCLTCQGCILHIWCHLMTFESSISIV